MSAFSDVKALPSPVLQNQVGKGSEERFSCHHMVLKNNGKGWRVETRLLRGGTGAKGQNTQPA